MLVTMFLLEADRLSACSEHFFCHLLTTALLETVEDKRPNLLHPRKELHVNLLGVGVNFGIQVITNSLLVVSLEIISACLT